MMRTRAVAFDLDGTLFDSRADIVSAVTYAFESRGRPPLPPAGFLQYVGDGARMLCSRAAGLDPDDPEVTALVDGYVRYYVAHPAERTTWMPGARQALEELRARYRLAVCTNKPRAATQAVLAALDATELFATIVAGDDMDEKKPDPRPVLEIASRLGVAPGELVLVGDGPQDVEAGQRAGARTVGIIGTIVPAERLRSARPDVLLTTMADLPAVVLGWANS